MRLNCMLNTIYPCAHVVETKRMQTIWLVSFSFENTHTHTQTRNVLPFKSETEYEKKKQK